MSALLEQIQLPGDQTESKTVPCAVATWQFGKIGIDQCAPMLQSGRSAVDAVEAAIRAVELDNNGQYYVGVGGYPTSAGVMELDAAIMDHDCRYGAVMSLQDIANPISVARSIMEQCPHNILTGEGALVWAMEHGFEVTGILTEAIAKEWQDWIAAGKQTKRNQDEHDTVGVICLDRDGRLCAGTSTSGWKFKLPGRVGDSPMVGSGLYCDGSVGAAVATGDGEEIMRTCACFLVVESMRNGMDVQDACALAVHRITSLKAPKRKDDALVVGIVAMDKHGKIGAASSLCEANVHLNPYFPLTQPYFPVAYWRQDQDASAQAETQGFLKASVVGACI